MSRLLDRKVNGRYPFAYTPAARTDISETFRRIRRERETNERERAAKVAPISKKR